ncbi:hypothetical protein BD311DRAFT_783028 [Dichomitus squalens]|uniref:Uncharacterized protein n=1 Tax=Dichomitus squalens TaxID=114155 RepID=A0A4Q9M3A8_9APHY|nr:hypothetical protein BD311DRAFT_783028 [Dichomitus squalens]
MQRIKAKTVKNFSILNGYEDGWPVTAYLKTQLLRGDRITTTEGRLVEEHDNDKQPDNVANCHLVGGLGHQKSVPVVKAGPLPDPPSTKSPLHLRKKQFSLNGARHEAVPVAGKSAAASGDRVPQHSRDGTNADPRSATEEVLGWLVAFNVPPADAQWIEEMLAGFGVNDSTYLQGFARMASRDEWLRELRDSGELTEIQMRMIRDMLEYVARQ